MQKLKSQRMMNIMLGNISNFAVLYLFIINFIGFVCMYLDKEYAKHKQFRISESFLFKLSLFGGVIGAYLGLYYFRHKTKKLKFVIGLPIILLIYIFLWINFFKF